MPQLTKLNLGAGNRLATGPGVVNHDVTIHRPEISVAHNLNDIPWPWPDESFDTIVAWSVLEHLRINLVESLNECWRILRPDGTMQIKLPLWNVEISYNDPTHYWQFGMGIFDQFDPDTKRGKEYDFYTPYKWKLLQPVAKSSYSSLHTRLQKRPLTLEREGVAEGDRG